MGQGSLKNEDEKLKVLMSKLKSGDETCAQEFVELVKNHLFKFCYFLCHNKETADELTQETLLRALGAFTDGTKVDSPASFIFKVAKNLFIDQLRKDENENKKESSIPSDSTEEKQLPMEVQFVLQQIEDNDRILLTFCEMQGHSIEEAAQLFETTEAAIKTRLMRAREKFKNIWNKES